RIERLRVEGAELEDVADLDRRLDLERAAALRACVAGLRLPDVEERRLVVATRRDAAEVPAVLVRARHVLTLAERFVGNDLDVDPDRAERAAAGAERVADLVVCRRAKRALEERLELLGAEPVVSAYEREDEPVAGHDGERFR